MHFNVKWEKTFQLRFVHLYSFNLTIRDIIDFPNDQLIPNQTEKRDHKTVM